MADFNKAIPKLLVKEGGAKYTEIPGDKGGATKYGISQRAYPQEDIKGLTEERARELYLRDYWDKCTCGEFESQEIAETLFESAVNMGPITAVQIAQFVAGVNPDGKIGAVTRKAIAEMGVANFICQYKLAIIARYAHQCNKDRTQTKFLLGWINRVLGGV